MPFSPPIFVLCAGVAAIAWWVASRYPRIAPRTKGGVTAWILAALAVTALASVVFAPVAAVAGPVVAFALVVLPSGICVMLATAWATLSVGEAVGLRR